MFQEQNFEKSELSDSKVRGIDSLQTLFPSYPDAHMGLLYHCHVIRSIADRQCTYTRYAWKIKEVQRYWETDGETED